eukprot:28224-Chlamydomonas_euryale.AAC.1
MSCAGHSGGHNIVAGTARAVGMRPKALKAKAKRGRPSAACHGQAAHRETTQADTPGLAKPRLAVECSTARTHVQAQQLMHTCMQLPA